MLCVRVSKVENFGLPQIQVFHRARYLQVPNNFRKLLWKAVHNRRQTDSRRPTSKLFLKKLSWNITFQQFLDVTYSDANQEAGTYQPQPQRNFEDEIQ